MFSFARCGVPPCGCSRPPCGACEALEVAPKLKKAFKLMKRFDFSGPVQKEFDVVQIADQNLTHSCSDYVNDGTTAFTSKGQLHVKVSGVCPDGRCLKSGGASYFITFSWPQRPHHEPRCLHPRPHGIAMARV